MRKKHKYLQETKEDKQFRQMLVSMIASIFLCVFCLVGSTWALFETSFTSVDSTLSIGEMEIEIISTKGGSSVKDLLIPTEPNTYVLREVGTYTIVLHNTGNIPGYCNITLTDAYNDSESFTTGTLNPMGYDVNDTATISIEITAEDNFNGILPITLYIEPCWGKDPNTDIQVIDEDLFVPETEETEPEETEETEPEETEPKETEPKETTPDATTGNTTPTEPNTGSGSGTQTTPTVPDSSEPTVPDSSEPTVPDSSEPTTPDSSEPTEPQSSEPSEPQNTDPVQPANNTSGDPAQPGTISDTPSETSPDTEDQQPTE